MKRINAPITHASALDEYERNLKRQWRLEASLNAQLADAYVDYDVAAQKTEEQRRLAAIRLLQTRQEWIQASEDHRDVSAAIKRFEAFLILHASTGVK
jgi:hypothetical protein